MPWHKLGLVYEPRPLHPKLATHAANPVPVRQGDGSLYRVLFSGRDAANRSSVGWVDIDIATALAVGACDRPLFEHGAPGSFHADGVSIGNIYAIGARRYLPFMGWQAPPGDHWRGDIGRLRVGADGGLALDPEGIWIGASAVDPLSLSYPWILRQDDGLYRMWYGSTHAWDAGNGEMLHLLHAATSTDGHHWTLLGPAVPHGIGKAQAFSRPTVARMADGGWRMWFSFRAGDGRPYRIGCVASQDLQAWHWVDAGIDVSADGWDSEMLEYPYVWWHGDQLLMLYNGNGYGRTGFGLARWDQA